MQINKPCWSNVIVHQDQTALTHWGNFILWLQSEVNKNVFLGGPDSDDWILITYILLLLCLLMTNISTFLLESELKIQPE